MLLYFCKMEESYCKLMHLNDKFYHFTSNRGCNGLVEDQAQALEHVLSQTRLVLRQEVVLGRESPAKVGQRCSEPISFPASRPVPYGPPPRPPSHLLEDSRGLTVWGNGMENLFYISGVYQTNGKMISAPCSLFVSLLADPRSRLPPASGSMQDLTAGSFSSYLSLFLLYFSPLLLYSGKCSNHILSLTPHLKLVVGVGSLLKLVVKVATLLANTSETK